MYSESGHLCMQNCSDNIIVEGLHMKKAMVPPNKSSRNPRWLPKFTNCKNGHYYAKCMHKMAYLCNVIQKLTQLKMLV